jgi:tetratricopeptide (TPR) repeat protein
MNTLEEAQATFGRAVEFLRAGDAPMTERITRAALEDFPGETNFLTLLGAALLKQGKPQEALPHLCDAVAREPEYAKGHEQLGEALVALGRPEEAVDSLRRALEINPGFEAAQLKLGQLLLRLGREDEAGALLEAFIRQKPHREKLAEAAELHRNGKHAEAEAIYREILRSDPGNVTAIRLLAMVAMKLEQYRDAVVLLQKALELAPDYTAARLDLGTAQMELNRFEDAVATMQGVIRIEPRNYAARMGLANALARSHRTEEAVGAYEQAIEIRPELAAGYLGLGNVLRTLGDYDRSVAAYRSGIAKKPEAAEIYWSLSNLKTFRFRDDEVAAMREMIAKDGLDPTDEVHLSFALGKALEDAGDYAAAFVHYDHGNRLRRMQEHYDPVHTEDINRRIRTVFTAEFIAERQGLGYRDARPIFIVGLPRSGSTLLEQILASHALVEATHELAEGGRLVRQIERHAAFRERYPEAIATAPRDFVAELGKWYDDETRRHRRLGAPYFIDKMPNNFANVGLLALALPEAVFIDARRDPLDTCLSCYKQLFARGQSFTYDLEEIGLYYLEYRRMTEHWDRVLPGRVLCVRYEDVIDDLEGQVRRLLAHCGLPWDEACLDFYNTQRPVRTASSEQVRRPLYRDSMGIALRYGDAVDALRETLAPLDD